MTDTVREITDHAVNPCNDTLTIKVLDLPRAGGANHWYQVSGFDNTDNVMQTTETPDFDRGRSLQIVFQNGPINEVGVNGITQEVLLAIVADRLRSFQKGPYACKANACALTHIEEAQHWLQQRTLERMRRGVEGTHNK